MKSIANVKDTLIGLLDGKSYRVYEIDKDGNKQEMPYSPIKMKAQGIQDANGNLRHVSTNHYFEVITQEESLEKLYPKWNCPKCKDWFHMPYKFCRCDKHEEDK